MEKLPQPKTCCKCNLRTGVILICMTEIAWSSYLILALSVSLSRLSKENDIVEVPVQVEEREEHTVVDSRGEEIEEVSTEKVNVTMPVKLSHAKQYAEMVFSLLAALILGVGFSILYLVGVEKEKASYMKPALVANGLGVLVFTLQILISIFSGMLGFFFVVLCLIAEAMSIYFFLVLHSYYRQLVEGLLQPESMVMPQQVQMMPPQQGQQAQVAESSFIAQQQPQLPQYQAVLAPDGQQMVMAPHQELSNYDSAVVQQPAPGPPPAAPIAPGHNQFNPFLQ